MQIVTELIKPDMLRKDVEKEARLGAVGSVGERIKNDILPQFQ